MSDHPIFECQGCDFTSPDPVRLLTACPSHSPGDFTPAARAALAQVWYEGWYGNDDMVRESDNPYVKESGQNRTASGTELACGHHGGPYPNGSRPRSAAPVVSGCPECGSCL